MTAMITVENLSKIFILHQQGGVRLTALCGVSLEAGAGECLALAGPSGAGKSSLLRCLYGNYLPTCGRVRIRHRTEDMELTTAAPQKILEMRRETISYVSQFLRVIPRVSALNIVAEPLLEAGENQGVARNKARILLERLHIPARLWDLSPSTFSGGEQQRVNIARGFIRPRPIMLLDEPTASLDAANRRVVKALIEEARQQGSAIIGIFHDDEMRKAVADREYRMTPHKEKSNARENIGQRSYDDPRRH